MKRNLIIIIIVLVPILSFSQTKDQIAESLNLGRIAYSKEDYFEAYKQFLSYKYYFLDKLNKPENKQFSNSLDEIIKFCENKIKFTLTYNTTTGDAWKKESGDEIEEESLDINSPELPDIQPSLY